jgi:hypothetical protein
LVDINGIFGGRFNVVLTNPPFGATVRDDQKIGSTPETRVEVPDDVLQAYVREYGPQYKASYDRWLAAERNHDTLLSMYDLGRDESQLKTELLFLERCLHLLAPGGRLGIVVPDGSLNNPSLSHIREYLEDRADILAVVSIPDKTFKSAKTNVKASLLLLRKLEDHELAARTAARARHEQREFTPVAKRLALLQAAMKVTFTQYARTRARSRPPTSDGAALPLWPQGADKPIFEQRKRDLRAELRALSAKVRLAARQLVRREFDYDVFMAVADHVGIRASGRVDPLNELHDVLRAWQAYQAKPSAIPTDVREKIFRLKWSDLDRWDPLSFRPIDWRWPAPTLKPLGSALRKRVEPVDREKWDFADLTPITIHFDGSLEPRDLTDTDEYTMELFFARPGDIIVSKIDLKNGAVAIAPDSLPNVVVTNHFVVYEPDPQKLHAPYLIRLIQTPFFKDYLWRKKVGSEGRKEVKIELFERTPIPLPTKEVQQSLISAWEDLDRQNRALHEWMAAEKSRLAEALIGGARIPKRKRPAAKTR